MPDEYLTAAEARALLDVAKSTFARMCRDGRLVAHSDPTDRRRTLVRRADVERLLRREPPASDPPTDPRRRAPALS